MQVEVPGELDEKAAVTVRVCPLSAIELFDPLKGAQGCSGHRGPIRICSPGRTWFSGGRFNGAALLLAVGLAGYEGTARRAGAVRRILRMDRRVGGGSVAGTVGMEPGD